ncbi:GDSL-type esterase/lipase family protein [Flavobacterium sp.]|uniref:GDSL-type esterase/lipase family protein n=1 Tax=Flavobacterium sp. TaxID=239 RepID=UPI0025B8C8E4|nr:GDSL-type esterase/lipase family protein [Flavobacterium sp.]
MKHLKFLLIASLSLNLFAAIFFAKKLYVKYNASIETIEKKSDTTTTYWLKRNQLFEVLPKDKNTIVFLGNSLTQHFELAELFKNLNIRNRGINGDVIPAVIKRLSPITESCPKKIFIEIGINDLGRGAPKDTVIKNYEKLLERLQTECGSTRLFVQSIFPVANKSKTMAEYCSPKLNADIKFINQHLKEYSSLHDITFLDFHDSFVTDGELNPKFSVDGVHLTGEAYLLWTELLKPYVND